MTVNLLVATSNPGKKTELLALLSEFPFILLTPKELGIKDIPKETGATYQENAMIKARYYHDFSRMPVLADDTGLEVDALNGQPGLFSARFSPDENAGDAERRKLLIQKLSGKPQPWSAHFTCTAVLIDQMGRAFSATGRCDGRIISLERGTNGFGYDPLFYFPELTKTMAELDLVQKNQISHRAQAIRALGPELMKLAAWDS
jgi:XTP/dITP diphosphohydrolase